MAGKALLIVTGSIDSADMTCKVQYPNGVAYKRTWSGLDKNTLIVLARCLGHKFVGKTPMRLTTDELRTVVYSYKGALVSPLAGTTTTYEAEAIKPTQPTTPTPPTVVANNSDRVASAVRDVISEALRSVGIDEDAVKRIIESALVAERIVTNELIKDTRPIVTQVVLSNGAVRTVKGITHEIFPKVLKAVSRGQHIWMTGSSGSGKTTIAEQVAESLGVKFSSDSYNSQSSKADIKGYKSISDNLYQSTGFRDRFEHGGVYLLDEIDASNPNILTTLNSALANSSMGFPDGMVKRHPSFVAIAAANTWGNGATAEHVGRVAIDGATIDRFAMVHIKIDERMETELVRGTGIRMDVGEQWLNIVRHARRNVDSHGLKVIVSPRASIGGAHLLDSGFSWQETVEMRLLKGSKPDVANKIMADISVPSGTPIA